MTCADVRDRLLTLRRRRVTSGDEAELRTHLAGCSACARADAVEAALDEALARLPRRPAPEPLKRRLAMLVGPPGTPRRPPRAAPRVARAAALAAAAVVLFAVGVLAGRTPVGRHDALELLAAEAVGDHLRVLVSGHPRDVESGGSHQVKPWFEGRLDFAPVVPAPDVPDLRLTGGAVGWFLDRRAALVQYALRQHAVTLVAFRDDGLDWPAGSSRAVGAGTGHEASLRGFQVVLWRAGGVGYALVADVNEAELVALAGRFADATRAGAAAP